MSTQTGEMLAAFRAGRYEQALSIVDAYLGQRDEPHPVLTTGWRFRGDCLLQLGRFREAGHSYKLAALIRGPGWEDALLLQALSECNGERYSDAVGTLRTILDNEAAHSPRLAARARKMLDEVRLRALRAQARDAQVHQGQSGGTTGVPDGADANLALFPAGGPDAK
jgi:hypothetical protein